MSEIKINQEIFFIFQDDEVRVQDINLDAFDHYEGSGDATKAPESRVPMTNGHPEKGLYNVTVVYKRTKL